jgi:hypothetical protein
MNPYSHIVVASKLELHVKPEDPQQYYWGAIAPDIRYVAAVQRQQTHIPVEKIIGFMARYPHRKSFLQGYLVHCLADEIELGQVFLQHFPFSLLRSKFSRQRVTVLLELYYLENEKLDNTVAGTHNEVFSELGLSEAQSARLALSIREYATSPYLEARITNLSRLLGLENDPRIDKYLAAAKQLQRNWLLRSGLFFGIRTGKISEQIVARVAALYQQYGI